MAPQFVGMTGSQVHSIRLPDSLVFGNHFRMPDQTLTIRHAGTSA